MNIESMALQQYEFWYKQKVSPNLTHEEKMSLAKRISEASLKKPIYLTNLKYPLEDFPEIAPFSSLEQFSGMQLWAVFTEIMRELGAPVNSASEFYLTTKSIKNKQR